MSNKEVVIFSHPAPLEIVQDRAKFEDFLGKIKDEVSEFEPDLSTDASRKRIASLAYKVARTKTYLDDCGKTLNEERRKAITVVDNERRNIREQLDALRDEIRKPLTEWEEAKAELEATVQATIADLRQAMVVEAGVTSGEIADRLTGATSAEMLKRVEMDEAGTCYRLHKDAVEALENAHERACKEEQERAELERLRAEDEERKRAAEEKAKAEDAEQAERQRIAEAAERARLEAEAKAEAERAEIERAHAAELAAAKAESDRVAQAAIDAENAKKEAETQAAKEQAAREADKKHRSTVMGAAKDGLMASADIDEDTARKIVLAIAAGEIPNVTMRF